MGLIGEFEITCEALPFVGILREVPDADLEVEMQFNHGRRPLFFAYLTAGPPAAVERAFEESGFVGGYTLVGRAGETRRYQVTPAVGMEERLGDHVEDLDGLRGLASVEAIVDRIEVTPTGWVQVGWFADRAAFREFRTFWRANGGFSLRRLVRDGEPEPPGDGLTDPQREALRTAYELGYFEVPRGTSLDEVADELGITSSSASERLRRAQTHLLETTVASTWPPLPE